VTKIRLLRRKTCLAMTDGKERTRPNLYFPISYTLFCCFSPGNMKKGESVRYLGLKPDEFVGGMVQ